MAFGGLDGKTQADPNSVNPLEGLIDNCLIDLSGLPADVQILLADAPGRSKFLAPFEVVSASCRLAFLLLRIATLGWRLAIWLSTSSMVCSSLNRSARAWATWPPT